MSKVYLYKKEEMGSFPGCRTRYTYATKTNKNEDIVIELQHCESKSMMDLWLKHGYIKNELKNWISVTVYATDEKGVCRGRYNPQILPSTNKINFDWVIEDTPGNRCKILDKIVDLSGLLPSC